jgi:hypothetical protein
MTHIVLFLFITAENTDLSDVRGKKVFENRAAEGSGTSGNEKG